ncbi:hypothetical protein [Altererythrobacter sp. GH1-8]|uniref:hypothetical protein n=1 Tax=Altererythrobacter sp. GH1-8 TaxID=3349333 RepID=UPI00374CDC2A
MITSTQAIGQEPWKKFWLSHGIHQGMTEAEFNEKAVEYNFKVEPLTAGDDTKVVKAGDTDYWLLFCDGKLTYASWTFDTNEELIKSLNERINKQGFRMANYEVSSQYNDATGQEFNQFTMRLDNPERAYSVTYVLFEANGQVTVEDTEYDDTHGCIREGS